MPLTKTKINQQKLAKAKEMHAKLKNLRVAFRRHWTIYGEISIEFEKQEFFKLLGFRSMKHYLKSLDKACYSTIAEAMAVIKSLPEMSTKEMALYPKENLKILAKLPESKRTALRAQARDLTAKQLRVLVNKKFDSKLEAKTRIMFDVETSAVKVIDKAIEKKQDEDEDDHISRGTAIEYICAEFLQN